MRKITKEGICLNLLILNVAVLFIFLSPRISVLEAKRLFRRPPSSKVLHLIQSTRLLEA